MKDEPFCGKDLQRREPLDSDTAYGTPVQAETAAEEIRKASERPEGASAVEKAASWTALQAGTLLNTSTGHVAELMIEGNAKGITDLMKTVKKNQEAKREYCELAEELMDFEEKNIECLKNYLDE